MHIDDKEYTKYKYFLNTKLADIEKETNLCPNLYLYSKLYKDMDKYGDRQKIDSLVKGYLPNQHYKLFSTLHTQIIAVTIYNAVERKETIFPYVYLLSLIYYNLILNRYVKYCDNNVLSIAFDLVKSTNIFSTYGVLKGLEHISKSVIELHKDYYKEYDTDPHSLELLIQSLRTRIVQSLKSIVRQYYNIKERNKDVDSKNQTIMRYIEHAKHKLLMLGIVPITEPCKYYAKYIEKLKDIEPVQLEKALIEIFNKLGIDVTQQKITQNIGTLEELETLCKYLGMPISGKYCLAKTLVEVSTT